MNIGDIVVVVDSESIQDHFLGQYGKVVDVYETKVAVELNQRVKSIGSLVHTAYPSDLKKVGEANF